MRNVILLFNNDVFQADYFLMFFKYMLQLKLFDFNERIWPLKLARISAISYPNGTFIDLMQDMLFDDLFHLNKYLIVLNYLASNKLITKLQRTNHL